MELINELKKERALLLKRIDALNVLLESYGVDCSDDDFNTTNNNNIVPKGVMKWEDYAVYVLRQIGGKAKASEVLIAAIEANPNIDKKTIKSAIRSKLASKGRAGDITAIKGKYPKDGSTYELDSNKMIRTK